MIRIKLLTATATMPTRGTAGAAGLDIYADEDKVIPSSLTAGVPITLVKTGIALELPTGWEGQVRGRSGMTKDGVLVQLGTIDSDYRGEISVMICNINKSSRSIKRGDRIAQLVVSSYDVTEPVNVDTLTATARGTAGFGSTGA